jgi:hypothetical protein
LASASDSSVQQKHLVVALNHQRNTEWVMFEVNQAGAECDGSAVFTGAMEMSPETIDRALRRIARAERASDLEKARFLTEAVRQRIWAYYGRASILEYLEELFGYTPKVAREYLRIAFAIEALPQLAEMLSSGEHSFTALREISRIATRETIDEWRAAARGMNVRQVEQLVSAHRKGDRPSDPPNPDLALGKLTLEMYPATRAKVLQARQLVASEHDGFLDDDAFIDAVFTAFLDGGGPDQGRARHQIMTTVCSECKRGWQDAAGRVVAIDAGDVERAECDAQRVGSDREPERATQDIAPMVRRFVWRRDHGRCCVPSCRASRNIDIHHIVHREHGGDHGAGNLTLLCGGHHRALHEGKLAIRGVAPELTLSYRAPRVVEEGEVVNDPAPAPAMRPTPVSAASELRSARLHPPITIPVPMSHVGPGSYASVVVATLAKQALTALGFAKREAAGYVDQALAANRGTLELEALIRAALQRSRRDTR